MTTRRTFIKNISTASLVTAVPISQVSAKNPVITNETVKVGLIGVHGMGWANLSSFLKNKRMKRTHNSKSLISTYISKF